MCAFVCACVNCVLWELIVLGACCRGLQAQSLFSQRIRAEFLPFVIHMAKDLCQGLSASEPLFVLREIAQAFAVHVHQQLSHEGSERTSRADSFDQHGGVDALYITLEPTAGLQLMRTLCKCGQS